MRIQINLVFTVQHCTQNKGNAFNDTLYSLKIPKYIVHQQMRQTSHFFAKFFKNLFIPFYNNIIHTGST